MLNKIINFIGYGVCHQLPERSFHYGGVQLPICARDTGIYFGFLLSFIYLSLTHKKRENSMARPWILILAGLGIAVMAFDGLSSYLGFRETNNSIRLITGLLTGFALPVFLVPIFNYQIWKKSSNKRILENTKTRIGLVFLIIGAYFFFIINIPAYRYFLPYLAALVVFLTFALINIFILTIIPFWFQAASKWKDLTLPIILSLILAGLEIFFAAAFHSRMQSIALWIINLIY